MLRWLKTVVVSDVEKAHGMRQVGIGKTVRCPRFRGSLLTCRQARVASKPWPLAGLWEQGLAGNPVSGQVVSGIEAA